MATFAIGDIHGCLTALNTLIGAVRPGRDDAVVLLGDYVNRGPDARGVIDRILYFQNETHVVALRGNHDAAMLDAQHDEKALRYWLKIGGEATLASYPGGTLGDVPPDHWKFLEHGCRDWHETAERIFVHATVDPKRDMDEQTFEDLRWARLEGNKKGHKSGKTVICGHTSQREGVPLDLGHTICIDTGCVYGLWLTCLDVDTGHYWQTNQSGAVREGDLSR